MADEELAIAELPGQETAPGQEAETEQHQDEPENLNVVEQAEGEEGAQEQELETVEIDWDDGQKYVIPKALEAGLLKNKDYTTKTQEVSARKKALEAKEAEIEERLKVTESELDDRASLRSIDKQLEAYAKLTPEDWAYHEAQDPARAQQAFRHYQMLKDQKSEVSARLDTYGKERSGKAEQELATRIQETLAHAQKSIPGFSKDTIPQLVDFAQKLGVPEEAITRNWSPVFMDMLHLARIGKMTVDKQSAPIPRTPIQPLTKVNGKASPGTVSDLAKVDDMDTYVALRKQGVGGKPAH